MKAEETKKEIKVKIPYSAFIIVGAVVILAIVILVQHLLPKTVYCTNEQCFDKQFATCQSAQWTDSNAANTSKYKINGKSGKYCVVTFSNSELSSVSLKCNFDNKVDFASAQEEVYNHPKEADCRKG